jgi:hypothetical protein
MQTSSVINGELVGLSFVNDGLEKFRIGEKTEESPCRR